MCINREIGAKLESNLRQFKAVLVAGARQTGKTTMLRHCLSEDYEYATLDDLNELDLAISDPKAFLNEPSAKRLLSIKGAHPKKSAPLAFYSSSPLAPVILWMRSMGKGGQATGLMAMPMSTMGLSSAAHPVTGKLPAAGAAVDDGPLAVLSDPHGHGLHEPSALGSAVARVLAVQVCASKTVRAVVAVVAASVCFTR